MVLSPCTGFQADQCGADGRDGGGPDIAEFQANRSPTKIIEAAEDVPTIGSARNGAVGLMLLCVDREHFMECGL